MKGSKRLVAAAAVAITVSGSFVIGQMTGTRSAEASPTRAYTLQIGDGVTIPAIKPQ